MTQDGAGIVLSPGELEALTGYRRPCDQITELLRQGYYRARRSSTTGTVILERAHYEAVARGVAAEPTPKLRQPKLKAVA